MHPFDRCGLASLDDFDTPEYRRLFSRLETMQAEFLSREADFREGGYRWESDTLHGWSRCWEYPYALHHLKRFAEGERANKFARPQSQFARPQVLDMGSGVTFFPFCVAREGFAVTCVDSDPVAAVELPKAAAVISASPGSVSFCAADATQVPLADGGADAAYCVSVLEHTADPEAVIVEIARMLRAGGLFVLTIDLDLLGTAALGPEKFASLRAALRAHFEPAAPEATIHPRRMLESFNSPYPRARQPQVPGIMLRTRRGDLKPLVGGPIASEPLRLTCYAAVARRRAVV